MRFKKFLITEETITIDQALGALGLTASDLGDIPKIKKAFKDLSKKHHPDLGGTKERQQLLNAAWEKLKGTKSKTFDKKEWEAKRMQTGLSMRTMMLHAFTPDTFIRHFNKFTNEKLSSNISNIKPNEKSRIPEHYAGFTAEFFNADRSIVFELQVWASISDAFKEDKLGFGNIQFPIHMVAYGFARGKKQKLGKRDWKFTSDHSFFKNPEIVFPDKKLQAIFSGKTSARKFQKRDMITYIEKRLKGRFDGTYATIPLLGEFKRGDPDSTAYSLLAYRTVFMRMPAWAFNGIYKGLKRISMSPFVTMPENEDTANFFYEIQRDIQRSKPQGDEKVIKAVNTIIQRYKDSRK